MKKITKLLALIICLVMAVGLLPSVAVAGDEEPELVDSGLYRGDLYWGFYDDGTLALVGEGTVTGGSTPWSAYRNDILYIIVDEGVTSIGANSFNNYPNLLIVLLSRTVKSVSTTNFADCPSFIAFYVDEDNPSLAADELGVLYNKSMTTIYRAPTGTMVSVVPKSVRTITSDAYKGCDSLTRIFFEGDLPANSANAFDGVTSYAYYYVDNPTWANIEDKVFNGAEFAWFGIVAEDFCGDEVAYMLMNTGVLDVSGAGAMYDYAEEGENVSPFSGSEDINYIIFSGDITHIGKNAFNDCPMLQTLVFTTAEAPTMTDAFKNVRAVGAYPSSWTGTPADHGGDILWVKYDMETGEMIGTGIKGDVNVDGDLTNADLILIARYVVDLIEENSFQHEFVETFGDMDDSGVVTNADIIALARLLVGLE